MRGVSTIFNPAHHSEVQVRRREIDSQREGDVPVRELIWQGEKVRVSMFKCDTAS